MKHFQVGSEVERLGQREAVGPPGRGSQPITHRWVVWANQFPRRAGMSHSGREAWFSARSAFRLWGHCRGARRCLDFVFFFPFSLNKQPKLCCKL